MKKLLFLLSGIVFLLSSCSGSDDDSQGNLITSMKYVGEDFVTDFRNHIFTFEYTEGDKIVRIADGQGAKTEFTYAGDLITQIDIWRYLNDDPYFFRRVFLQYDNEKLISIKVDEDVDGSLDTVIEFTYTDLNSANYTYRYYPYMNPEGVESVGTIIFDENDVLKKTHSSYDESGENVVYQTEISFTYDDKRHPYSTIRGFNDIKLFNVFFGSIFSFGFSGNDGDGFAPNLGTTHNVASVLIKEGQNLQYESTYIPFSYEYGSNGFPKKCSKIINGKDLHIECSY